MSPPPASRGLFLMEAMWTRFLPHVVEIRRLLADGALGRVVTVMADHGQWFAYDPSSRLFAPELGGGALLDLGVYPVSFASMVLGEPTRIEAHHRAGADRGRRPGLDPARALRRRAGRAQLHLVCCQPDAGEHRRDRRAHRCRRAVLRQRRLHVHAAAGNAHPLRSAGTRARPVLRGRRGRAVHRATGCSKVPSMPLDETVQIMATMDAVLARAS